VGFGEGDKKPGAAEAGAEGGGTLARDVVIVMHLAGRDHAWGATLMGGADAGYRPEDIVVWPDGTRAVREDEPQARTWGVLPVDAGSVRDIALELTRAMPARRIVLHGVQQGGVAALVAGSAFPRLYAGVVVEGGGLSEALRVGPTQRGLPVVLLHASEDKAAPLRWSIDARDIMAKEDFRVLALVRTYGPAGGASGGTDVARAGLATDWMLAMTSTDAQEALRLAERLLPGPDGKAAGVEFAPGFGLAARVLARFELEFDKGAWPRGFEVVSDAQRARARELLLRVEGLGLRHAASLRADVPDAKALASWRLEPESPVPDWLGHVLALREDFRGVGPVEAYLKEIGFDEAQGRQDLAARPMIDAFEQAQRLDRLKTGQEAMGEDDEVLVTPAQAVRAVVEGLSGAALFEGLPHDLLTQCGAWVDDPAAKVRVEDAGRLVVVRLWARGVLRGRERYRAINQGW
jgi:hypothetical protein